MNVWAHPLSPVHPGRNPPAPIDLQLIKRLNVSFERIASAGDRLPELVFRRLFERNPHLRMLFPDDLAPIKLRFFKTLLWLVSHLHEPQKIRLALVDIGRRHLEHGAKREHYPTFCDTLAQAMATIAGDAWNDELDKDWRQTIDLMAQHMLRVYPTQE
jgi:eukaryotic-like serine/threonine-protein kinase